MPMHSSQSITVMPTTNMSVPMRHSNDAYYNGVHGGPPPHIYPTAPNRIFLHQQHLPPDMQRMQPNTVMHQLPEPFPRRKILIELCQIYFTKVHGQVYAFLHPPSFMQAVVEDICSVNPAVLLGICAVSARFSSIQHDEFRPEVWAAAAVDIIFGLGSRDKYTDLARMISEGEWSGRGDNLEKPSLTCVQALSLLSYYHFGEGKSSLAWVMSGFAIRMAHALHLNEEFYDDPLGLSQNQPAGCIVSFKDREIRRRTFWALYAMDRLNSAGEHRPFTINNAEIKIQLPVAQALFDRESPAYTCSLDGHVLHGPQQQDVSANMDHLAWLIRILDIWGEVSCFAQRPLESIDWSEESPLMSLRSKAQRWSDSLPHHLKYGDGDSKHQPAGWYTMHAAYHLSLCVMHRFALPKSVSRERYAIDHIPMPYLKMCVKETIHHAMRVSELLMRIPSNVKVTAPFIGFAAFTAATIHAFLGFHAQDSSAAAVDLHRSYVRSTLTFLHDLGKAWNPLSKMHDALTSQIIHRPRSSRSNNSSILHEPIGVAAQEQFRVPDSVPTQFSNQQEVELNTFQFANWFNNPTTQIFFNPALEPPTQPGLSYSPNNINQYPPQIPGGSAMPQPDLLQMPIERQSTQKRPKSADAPYGDAFPIVDVGDNDDDAVAADLLVSFKQSEISPPPSRVNNNNTTDVKSEHMTQPEGIPPAAGSRAHTQYIDRLSNLRDSIGSGTGPVDILQLMKMGLITSQYWT